MALFNDPSKFKIIDDLSCAILTLPCYSWVRYMIYKVAMNNSPPPSHFSPLSKLNAGVLFHLCEFIILLRARSCFFTPYKMLVIKQE